MNPPQHYSDEFVVRYDHARGRRFFGVILAGLAVMWVCLLLAVRTFAALDGPPAHLAWLWAALLALITALIAFICYLGGTSVGLTRPWRAVTRRSGHRPWPRRDPRRDPPLQRRARADRLSGSGTAESHRRVQRGREERP